MPSTLLSNLLGLGVIETENEITILKSDLALVGLEENPDTLDCQLAAILKNAWLFYQGSLLDSDGLLLVDSDGVSLGYDDNALYNDVNIFFRLRYESDGLVKWHFTSSIINPTVVSNTAGSAINSNATTIIIDKTSLDLPDSNINTFWLSFWDKMRLSLTDSAIAITISEQYQLFRDNIFMPVLDIHFVLSSNENKRKVILDDVRN